MKRLSLGVHQGLRELVLHAMPGADAAERGEHVVLKPLRLELIAKQVLAEHGEAEVREHCVGVDQQRAVTVHLHAGQRTQRLRIEEVIGHCADDPFAVRLELRALERRSVVRAQLAPWRAVEEKHVLVADRLFQGGVAEAPFLDLLGCAFGFAEEVACHLCIGDGDDGPQSERVSPPLEHPGRRAGVEALADRAACAPDRRAARERLSAQSRRGQPAAHQARARRSTAREQDNGDDSAGQRANERTPHGWQLAPQQDSIQLEPERYQYITGLRRKAHWQLQLRSGVSCPWLSEKTWHSPQQRAE
jgi:hypothetical protein